MANDAKTINASPANNTANMTNEWFLTVSNKDEYAPQDGNTIELLNCGSAYLPRLRSALESARQSIYIAIWGMDDLLQLTVADGRNREEDRISTILQRRAEQDRIEVRILTWYSFIPDTFSDPLIRTRPFAWTNSARAGSFKGLEFLTRESFNLHDTESGKAKIENIRREQRELLNRQYHLANSVLTPSVVDEMKKVAKRQDELESQLQRIHGAGSNADDVQLKRMATEGWPTAPMGKFPTHHQKMILIDHRMDRNACGFVQGFNFWQQYFDFASHPYREGEATAHIQDVGAYIKGPCLVDLFRNFKEGWNKALSETDAIDAASKTRIEEQVPTIAPVQNAQTFRAQILRTWPFRDENNIYKFILGAIPKLNEFIYIEDQYFRMPEFVDALKKRGADIRSRSGGQKKLHLFAVISLNTFAYGEARIRQKMVEELGLSQENNRGVNNADAGFKQFYEDSKVQEDFKKSMADNGVMVHVCQLLTSKPLGNPPTVHYQNVYIHAKLSIYDDAYLLLGSANWNVRSMNQDSELDIAVQCHDTNKAKDFREQLWGEHLNHQISPDKYHTPEKWYKRWDDLLRINWKKYANKQSLDMNLFPYYEDITALSIRKNPLDYFEHRKRTET